MNERGTAAGRLARIHAGRGKPVEIRIDGEAVRAFESDTLLVAVLTCRPALRRNEFDGSARAGFCLMGACQDCWVWLEDGTRVRACTTFVRSGLSVLTRGPKAGSAA